ncbi:LysR family transcriptional regulator [Pseudooceanicola nitratireducens]|uniref:LysR family transcriptional regulator n=1 Tax=Pseudooceanicola nitratireducens TaxID=517719 RepID=UPI003516AC02
MPDIRNPYATFGRYSADLSLFVLVARAGQLSSAAKDAGLSQPRVSQRIRALEDSLDRQLLVRERRGVRLTPDGRTLFTALQGPLHEASTAFETFCRVPRREEVVILTDIAFASFRLLPEFPSLNAAFPDVGVSLMSRQMPDASHSPNAHLMIRMERIAEPPQGGDTLLFRERVSAVCSPGYKTDHPELRVPQDLPVQTAIDLVAGEDAPWYTWRSWLSELGVAGGMRGEYTAFDSFDHVIRAARSGLGVALCWEGLLDLDAPDAGLVRAVPQFLESDRGYVLRPLSGMEDPKVAQVHDWLRDTFQMG